MTQYLEQAAKASFELAVVELHDTGVVLTYPLMDEYFEVVTWEEWENSLRHVALPGDRHPEGQRYVDQAEHTTFTTGVLTFAFLIPWNNH